jgi:hypothetical protein
MRKITTTLIFLFLALFLFLPSAAYAQGHSLAVAVDLNAAKVCNFNAGWVGNFAFTRANTGWNWTFDGDSMTGNAHADADVGTETNSSSTAVAITDTGMGPIAVNSGMSYGGEEFGGECFGLWCWLFSHDNIAIAADLNLVKVKNFNVGMVDNLVFTRANTGWNLTFGGSSDTGNATAEADVDTELNSSTTSVAIHDYEWGPVAANFDYGFAGQNNGGDSLAVAVDLNAAKVKNSNMGRVSNLVTTRANTGHNVTGGEMLCMSECENGDGASSNTGNATAEADVDTELNSSSTTVAIVDSGSGAVAANVNSGSTAIAVEANLAKVKNTNLGAVTNIVETSANTGLNHTVDGSSDTGNAVADTSVDNEVNTNETNVSISDTSGGPTAVNADEECGGPCDGDVIDPCVGDGCGGSGGTVAANVDTEGTAVAADVDAVEVKNTNMGMVINETDTTANTGANHTCGEETETDTGNATASTEVDNTVNTNTTTVVIMD